jgi:hypothetical protein
VVASPSSYLRKAKHPEQFVQVVMTSSGFQRPHLWQPWVQLRLWQFWQCSREHAPEILKLAAWCRAHESASAFAAFFFSVSGSAVELVMHILIPIHTKSELDLD